MHMDNFEDHLGDFFSHYGPVGDVSLFVSKEGIVDGDCVAGDR